MPLENFADQKLNYNLELPKLYRMQVHANLWFMVACFFVITKNSGKEELVHIP